MNHLAREVIRVFVSEQNRTILKRQLSKLAGPSADRFIQYDFDRIHTNYTNVIQNQLSLSDSLPGVATIDHVNTFNRQFITEMMRMIRDYVQVDDIPHYSVGDGLPASRLLRHCNEYTPNSVLMDVWKDYPASLTQVREDPSADAHGQSYGCGAQYKRTGIDYCDQSQLNTSQHQDRFYRDTFFHSLNDVSDRREAYVDPPDSPHHCDPCKPCPCGSFYITPNSIPNAALTSSAQYSSKHNSVANVASIQSYGGQYPVSSNMLSSDSHIPCKSPPDWYDPTIKYGNCDMHRRYDESRCSPHPSQAMNSTTHPSHAPRSTAHPSQSRSPPHPPRTTNPQHPPPQTSESFTTHKTGFPEDSDPLCYTRKRDKHSQALHQASSYVNLQYDAPTSPRYRGERETPGYNATRSLDKHGSVNMYESPLGNLIPDVPRGFGLHTNIEFGNATPESDARLLERRSFRSAWADCENGIPRYEQRLYRRNIERDVTENIRPFEFDNVQRAHDMTSLIARIDYKDNYLKPK